jgi:hypothetical protein
MTAIRFTCTATGHVLETKLKSDDDTLRLFGEGGLLSRCCFCGGQHPWHLVRRPDRSDIIVIQETLGVTSRSPYLY